MTALFLSFAGRARSQPAGFEWSGACRDAQGAFEARLGELVKPDERARLAGSVRVSPLRAGLEVRLMLVLNGRSLGERRFEAPSCQVAARTAAVAAAMAAFSEEPPGARAPDAVPPEPDRRAAWGLRPDPQPDFPRPGSGRRPEQRGVEWQPRVGVLGALHVGALPVPALGGALELGLGLGQRWSLAAQAGVTDERASEQGTERLARLRLLSGALRGCFAPFVGQRLRVDACAAAQLLSIWGRGSGFDVNHEASLSTIAPSLGLDFSWRAPPFLEWRVELEAAAPLSRQRFLVDGREAARAGAVAFALRLGPFLRF